ncbi:MAG: VOC family protein [Haloechinothrix sp.]
MSTPHGSEVRRIVPDLTTTRPGDLRDFYTGLLGLTVAMDQGWALGLVSETNPTAQLVIFDQEQATERQPDISIEVHDVDSVYATARRLGVPIPYEIRNEPWGVRRFFVTDPDGRLINILSHSGDSGS